MPIDRKMADMMKKRIIVRVREGIGSHALRICWVNAWKAVFYSCWDSMEEREECEELVYRRSSSGLLFPCIMFYIQKKRLKIQLNKSP